MLGVMSDLRDFLVPASFVVPSLGGDGRKVFSVEVDSTRLFCLALKQWRTQSLLPIPCYMRAYWSPGLFVRIARVRGKCGNMHCKVLPSPAMETLFGNSVTTSNMQNEGKTALYLARSDD